MSKINLQEPQRNHNGTAKYVNLIMTSTVTCERHGKHAKGGTQLHEVYRATEQQLEQSAASYFQDKLLQEHIVRH